MSSRLRAFFGNAPIKLIAVILFAILVPSVLVTALGLVAVFQVDAFVRNHFSEPVRARVVELRDELMGSWEERLDLYEQYLQDAPQRFQHLGELRDRDPWVLDVLVSNESGLVRVPELPPLRLWSADLDHQLKHLYALELAASHQKALAESLRLLAESREDAVLVEALLAAARLSSRVGDDAEGERHLQRALDRYGHTQDSTGVVRAVPILWRLLEIRRAGGQVARAEDTARELLGALDRYQDLLDPEVETFYREKIATLGDMPPVEKNRPGAFRWSSTALLSIEPLLPQPGRGKRQSAHIPPDLDIVTFASSASGLRVHLLLDRSQLLEEAKIVGREKGLSEEGLSFGLVKGRPMVGVSDGDSPRDDIFSSLLPAPLGAFRLAYVPPAGDLPEGFRAFNAISAAAFTWAVIVLVLSIVVGVLFTLRSVLHATHTARLKSDFVSFISHELKTPLTSIQMFADTLLEGRVESEEESRLCVQMIGNETLRLARLVDQVLEYSKLEQQQKKFRFTSCDMGDVVREAAKIFKGHNLSQNEIELNTAQHISKIRMDRAAMVELFLNLFSNASKYSPRDEKIVVNLRESIHDITVDVVDRGIGIRKRDQKKVFEKFFRAEDYLTREVEGTGLGLAFARYIAKVHNGEIKVTSQFNSGSVFTLHLRKTHVLAE